MSELNRFTCDGIAECINKVDNRRNEPCAFAPIFDNGMALFPFAMEDDFRNLEAYAKTRTPVFGSSFDELAAAFMTDRQRKRLLKLIDFRFTRDRNYNLPAKRLKALERFLQQRVKSIMFPRSSKDNCHADDLRQY